MGKFADAIGKALDGKSTAILEGANVDEIFQEYMDGISGDVEHEYAGLANINVQRVTTVIASESVQVPKGLEREHVREPIIDRSRSNEC